MLSPSQKTDSKKGSETKGRGDAGRDRDRGGDRRRDRRGERDRGRGRDRGTANLMTSPPNESMDAITLPKNCKKG